MAIGPNGNKIPPDADYIKGFNTREEFEAYAKAVDDANIRVIRNAEARAKAQKAADKKKVGTKGKTK